MSGKLVIHKLESGINLRSLQITFEDGANNTSRVSYGDWSDCNEKTKRNLTKSSRLVVKIVSGNEESKFDLDSCAHEMNHSDTKHANISYSNFFTPMLNRNHEGINQRGNKLRNFKIINYGNDHNNLMSASMYDVNVHSGVQSSTCPFEYSLERVKENNARIMENIQMLNKTLNYAQTQEFDIVCPKSLRSYPCNICGKCFVYETGLKRHFSIRHSASEGQPRWQLVWTCAHCFQVWPRKDIADRHALHCSNSDYTDRVREIKASSLLQCEFCEKVYTNIPRLLKHAKVHNTINNYECNPCEKTFDSYKAVEQHWMECTWQKICYSFSLPKLWLCNACDRKFRNYEQLYNHRYKVGHFMTKMLESQVTANAGMFVYQCELCAVWFPSIPTLQEHQHHTHSRYDPTLI